MSYFLRYAGDPALHAPATTVASAAAVPHALLAALRQACLRLNALGLAAQHIGGTEAVIAATVEGSILLMLNPVITDVCVGTEAGPEGSVSIPGFSITVSRPEWITVAFNTETFERTERKFTGLEARCIAHEVEHLNGGFLLDHASRPQRRRAERIAEDAERATPTTQRARFGPA